MASSTLDLPVERPATTGKGHGTAALGPSDSSDSGSDLQGDGDDGGVITPTGRALGDVNLDSDTDSHGTGEVMAAGRDLEVAEAADIGVDRVIRAEQAGLGTGLDQAEEAQLGITVEEIYQEIRAGRADRLAQREDDVADSADDTIADASELVAGGVGEDELPDQMRSGSSSEDDADAGVNAEDGDAQ
ncbi:MAG: hypothetical protein ING59_08015 [Burkholderiales bacterium]|nr:hypothetical protein [Burkholderiales bacterium]